MEWSLKNSQQEIYWYAYRFKIKVSIQCLCEDLEEVKANQVSQLNRVQPCEQLDMFTQVSIPKTARSGQGEQQGGVCQRHLWRLVWLDLITCL